MAENSKNLTENIDFRLKFFNEAIVGKIIKKIHIRFKFNDKEKVLEAIIF